MNETNLSKRLQKVASFIPKGAKIADIGSDHAYLPCYAYLEGLISFAIAGEVNEGPYQSALGQVKKSELEEYITVRKGDGLEVLKPDEVDCITIAGMGGQLITDILENGKQKLTGVSRLILQPNVNAKVIREWFLKNEWELVSEEILEEDDKIYEILVADKGEPERPYKENRDASLLFGPFLRKQKNQAFVKKWSSEIEKWEKVKQQLDKAISNDEVQQKRKQVEEKINFVKEELSL